jgi:tetratricopeptide (TPR) repeat protein
MNAGDHAMEKGDVSGALDAYGAAQSMFPANVEMKYWRAVTLANQQLFDDALPLFTEVFAADENWRTLTRRIVSAGLLNVEDAQLKQILSLGKQ